LYTYHCRLVDQSQSVVHNAKTPLSFVVYFSRPAMFILDRATPLSDSDIIVFVSNHVHAVLVAILRNYGQPQ